MKSSSSITHDPSAISPDMIISSQYGILFNLSLRFEISFLCLIAPNVYQKYVLY
ncbi:hypothetical protein [Methanobrevibacter sp. 87.7]|uniref:hypothetical protein n=1 Tax=Methanobrevibacter sp. 87.7 TaxID=387957 RepID=UPI001E29A772|nr:hypothetical protein [Methanobrevibacter sp. 87.7]